MYVVKKSLLVLFICIYMYLTFVELSRDRKVLNFVIIRILIIYYCIFLYGQMISPYFVYF